MKILEMGTKAGDNCKRKSQNRNQEQEEADFKWFWKKENEGRHSHCDENCSGGYNWRSRKLDLPMFNGLEVDDWIKKVEKI